MSVVPTGLVRAAAVGAFTALVVATGGPAYAADDKPNISVTPDGPSSGAVTGTQTTTPTTPGQSGSSGTRVHGQRVHRHGLEHRWLRLDLHRWDHGAEHVRFLPGLDLRSL